MAEDNAAPEEETAPEEEKSEEELLAEWQNMAAHEDVVEAADSGEETEERILDQNEIDSLLGIDSGEGDEKTGVRALLDTSVVNYERLPMMEVIFDKFERYLSTSLRHFTADNVEINIEDINSVRFGDYLDTVPLPAGMVVVDAGGLDDYILMVYESRLIYAVVDILLGGRKARPARIEGRSFTTIERRIMENLTEVILHDLSRSFEPVAPIQFKMERMEVNPRFTTITRPGNAAILVNIKINLEERDGLLQFCLPYATLEPIREQLLQQFMGEKFGQDNIWENHLAQELYHANVDVHAVLDEVVCPLSEAMKWKIGDTLQLNARKDSIVKMKCGEVVKLMGHMGQADGMKAVRIARNVSDVNNEREDG
jgi:flagellar motor switch protein FliM